jgi:hypothetical protein
MSIESDNQLIKVLLELTQEVRELKEILRPELTETQTMKRVEDRKKENFLDALKFAERFDARI